MLAVNGKVSDYYVRVILSWEMIDQVTRDINKEGVGFYIWLLKNYLSVKSNLWEALSLWQSSSSYVAMMISEVYLPLAILIVLPLSLKSKDMCYVNSVSRTLRDPKPTLFFGWDHHNLICRRIPTCLETCH